MEREKLPLVFLLHHHLFLLWPSIFAGTDSGSALIHHRVLGQPVPSFSLFTKSPKIMESVWIRLYHEAPISPPTVLSFFFIRPSSLHPCLLFCKTLSPPISLSFLVPFTAPHPTTNPLFWWTSLLQHRPNVKGSFCAQLMERTLSNKDAHAAERLQQIGSFVSRPLETLSSKEQLDEGQELVCDLYALASAFWKESLGWRKVDSAEVTLKASHCTLLSSPSFDFSTVKALLHEDVFHWK